ncbi:MAG: tRNA(Ile)-lysidine synthetase-like protein [Candidatus Paceibacteria bacterium]|jgi:tRNA(Ile)-lysidine synthetase-like protein
MGSAAAKASPSRDANLGLDWTHFAEDLQLDPGAPVLVALSGGADSVYLLHALANASDRPALGALHVDHGLRAAESRSDAEFCRELCSRLGISLEIVRAQLDPQASDLERRARELRYQALGAAALAQGIPHVVMAHHRDDRIETLLMRWMRGSAAAGLASMRPRSTFPLRFEGSDGLALLRPMLDLSAEQVRSSLKRRGLAWCEDSSNSQPLFTRNRVRHQLLPLLRETCGAAVLGDLEAFLAALAEHEEILQEKLPELPFAQLQHRGRMGQACPRQSLSETPRPLLEPALYKVTLERTGLPLRRLVLDGLFEALAAGGTGHWNLRGGWSLRLTLRQCWLFPPSGDFRGRKR